ncbi:MAG: holo-ACP synthase [Coriobacteriia bacterium]|nr:holo-ACP synthase [Coriobacteriia bacterium]
MGEENLGGEESSAPDGQSLAGLGVDIIEIERMERAFVRVASMKARLFTPAEIAYAESKVRPIVHYALFFAAKEAVLKALGTGFRGMGWTDVEVSHDRFGRPLPMLSGAAQQQAEQLGVREVQLSLSYTHQVAVASAVAIKDRDRPPRDPKTDPKAELMRQFKEVRSILDEMDTRLQELESSDAPPPLSAQVPEGEEPGGPAAGGPATGGSGFGEPAAGGPAAGGPAAGGSEPGGLEAGRPAAGGPAAGGGQASHGQ